MIDPANVTVTLTKFDCPDTLQGWEHTFDLGTLSAGTHVVDLAAVLVNGQETSLPMRIGSVLVVSGPASAKLAASSPLM